MNTRSIPVPTITKVTIKLRGGVIEDVVSNNKFVDVLVLDYDTDGVEEAKLAAFPEDATPTAAESKAAYSLEVSTYEPEYANRLHQIAFDHLPDDPEADVDTYDVKVA